MRTLAAFTTGIALTIAIVWQYQPVPTTTTIIQTETELIEYQVPTSADELSRVLRRLDELDIDRQLPDDLHEECAYALYRATGDDMAGIIIYVRRHWEGDTCAAADHHNRHGWY
jgi:hypothetical protein